MRYLTRGCQENAEETLLGAIFSDQDSGTIRAALAVRFASANKSDDFGFANPTDRNQR